MFGLQDIYWVIINSFISFIYLFIISKLLGKKQIAQLEFIDYVVGISLGSIAADMSVETQAPFYHALIAMTIFFFLAFLVAIIKITPSHSCTKVTWRFFNIMNIFKYVSFKNSKWDI